MVWPLVASPAAFAPWVAAGLNHVRELLKSPIVVSRNLVELKCRSVRVALFDIRTAVEAFDRIGESGTCACVVLVRHFFVGRSRARALTVFNGRRKRERQRSHQRSFRADKVLGSYVELLLLDGRSVFTHLGCYRLVLSDPRPEPVAFEGVSDTSLCSRHEPAVYDGSPDVVVDFERLSRCVPAISSPNPRAAVTASAKSSMASAISPRQQCLFAPSLRCDDHASQLSVRVARLVVKFHGDAFPLTPPATTAVESFDSSDGELSAQFRSVWWRRNHPPDSMWQDFLNELKHTSASLGAVLRQRQRVVALEAAHE